MNRNIKIVIDTKGADNGPEELVSGALQALQIHEQLCVLLVGDSDRLRAQCESGGAPMDRIEFLDAPSEITNYDNAAQALYQKQDSSMLRALQAMGAREDLFGLISCGNTGILLTAAMRYLPGQNRVRPALAAVLPNQAGGYTCLVDTGATVDCTPTMLHHFAKLGQSLMRDMYGNPQPRIGLLSNGAEPTKGNKLVKETYPLLAEDESLCFVGNVEGSKALSGSCDVLVCDGFSGNQVLKVTEGTAKRIITDIFKYAKHSADRQILDLAERLKTLYDGSTQGGATILGVAKPVIKSHGNATAQTIVNSVAMLLNLSQNKALLNHDRSII